MQKVIFAKKQAELRLKLIEFVILCHANDVVPNDLLGQIFREACIGMGCGMDENMITFKPECAPDFTRSENSTMHDLKCWPEFFDDILSGKKSFEIRKNDRDFKEGDILFLREYDPETKIYTGRKTMRGVAYIARGPRSANTLPDDICVMALCHHPFLPNHIDSVLLSISEELLRAKDIGDQDLINSRLGMLQIAVNEFKK